MRVTAEDRCTGARTTSWAVYACFFFRWPPAELWSVSEMHWGFAVFVEATYQLKISFVVHAISVDECCFCSRASNSKSWSFVGMQRCSWLVVFSPLLINKKVSTASRSNSHFVR